MNITQLDDSSPFVRRVANYLRIDASPRISVLSDPSLLNHKATALFCSVKCPGNLILKTYDLARIWRDTDTAVISSFHSLMEHECFDNSFAWDSTYTFCPARSIDAYTVRPELKSALEQARLFVLSPFSAKQTRIRAETSALRNRFAAYADSVFVANAEPDGKTEEMFRAIAKWKKTLYTFQDLANANLLALGARILGDLSFTPILPP